MDLKGLVYKLLEDPDPKNRQARAIRFFIQILILINILCVILESVESYAFRYRSLFYVIEVVSVAIFSVEYLLRLYSCDKEKGRLSFIFSPYGIIDLLAILPFYLTFWTIDLRFLRAFRLFRLFRIAKMARYWEAIHLFGRVIQNKKEEIVSSFLIFFVFLTVNSGLIYFAEKEIPGTAFSSIPKAMWWGVVTMTTVGYGDMVPSTALGKLFGAFTAMIGIALFAIFAGVFVTGFSEELKRSKKKR